MREENLALLEQGYEAFGKGELDRVREMWTADAVWHTPQHGRLRAEYRGPDEIVEYLATMAALSGGSFKSEPEEFFADGDRVVSLDHVTGSRNGKVLDSHVMHLYRFRDGMVVEATTFSAEPKHSDDFWS